VIDLECLPYGVGHADEGVCLLLRLGPYRVLLDCGLENLSPLLDDLRQSAPVDLVLCTHAHTDHARGLLGLHRACPQLPIYASDVTAQLLPLNWLSEEVPAFCHALPWRSPIEFREGLSVQLIPAGHLPGAASLLLTYTTAQRAYTVFYTGDFFLSNSRLVEGLPLEELRGLKPDVLIVEGSYGTARHSHRRQQENQLAERINQALAEQRSVLLPVPTLGLGQELLMLLRSHHHFTGRNIDIWVDETIAAGCDAYLELLSHFPATVQNFARHQPLFWDDRIRPYVRRLSDRDPEKRRLSDRDAEMYRLDPEKGLPNQTPCIILVHQSVDLSRYCHSGPMSWLVLLPHRPSRLSKVSAIEQDIQASDLLQTQVQSGRLTIDTYLLTDHCDGPGTTQLIHNLRPQHVIFVHGSPAYLSDLTSLEELHNRYHLHSPAAGMLVELPVGETFLQPAAPETRYEGELTELPTTVMLTLPETLTIDPRWQNFADTGLVEARWQGEELVLRGLSQRELLSKTNDPPIPIDVECCENCQYCRGQRCWNQASPLYGFKVTPEGYCPAFEAPQFNGNGAEP
jgi:Cft2 family RNA processing exonuclease